MRCNVGGMDRVLRAPPEPEEQHRHRNVGDQSPESTQIPINRATPLSTLVLFIILIYEHILKHQVSRREVHYGFRFISSRIASMKATNPGNQLWIRVSPR